MDVFDLYSELYVSSKEEELTLQDYLLGCREDPSMYATAAERMIDAIGEPELIDTSQDPRFGRIFLNRTIKRYPTFADFYGMGDTIERIVGHFRYSAQGLEERKQILYLLGPVGGGKSSLAERLKQLMELRPVYVLKAGDEISPLFESPLGLFDPERFGDVLEDKYGIARRRLNGLMSPWAVKRLDEFGGDIAGFRVVRLLPSKLRQICVAKTEPGDENIRTSRRWSARSTSASSSTFPRPIPTPTASPAGSTARPRGYSNSSRCSRRRSRCCIRC